MRPVSVVQPRNRRLSFMNKKRKTSDPATARESAVVSPAAVAERPPTASHGLFPKETFYQQQQARLQSRLPSAAVAAAASIVGMGGNHTAQVNGNDLGRLASHDKKSFASASDERRPSVASSDIDVSGVGVNGGKMGSVRKRLSMLKLGKKTSRTGVMGSLDEE